MRLTTCSFMTHVFAGHLEVLTARGLFMDRQPQWQPQHDWLASPAALLQDCLDPEAPQVHALQCVAGGSSGRAPRQCCCACRQMSMHGLDDLSCHRISTQGCQCVFFHSGGVMSVHCCCCHVEYYQSGAGLHTQDTSCICCWC